LFLMRASVLHLCTKFEVRRHSHSEDIAQLRSWRSSRVGRTLVLAGELSLSCARLLAGRMITLWVRRPLSSLKLVCIIAREVNNFPTNFGVSRTFRSRLIGQHLSDALRDLATFDLGGHGACS